MHCRRYGGRKNSGLFMNTVDQQYLLKKKTAFISNCIKCKGLNLSCDCYPQYFLEVAKVNAGIPIKYREFTLAKINFPESQEVVKKVATYIQALPDHRDHGLGMYLWGNTGNAKTAMSCVILIEALKKGYSAYFTDLIKCMSFITAGWTDDEVKADFTKRILNSQFLVIDDVGKEYKSRTGFTEAHFDMIFRERANNLLPTILTSNLSPTNIATDYGKRLLSIFYEHLLVVETNSTDYRRKVLAPQNAKTNQSKKKDIT
jgi:DNA replication protein DnaC